MSTRFPDHFSGHANEYAAARPTYPTALFEYLASVSPAHARAWDCATGSGQAAVELAKSFKSVIATDASAQQIKHATPADNVDYRMASAEASNIETHSVDLITVAQALHWFDFDRFHAEVKRVAVPDAIVAFWSYRLTAVNSEVDDIIQRFYCGAINPYWPPERSHVESEYRDIPFPYQALKPPQFEMHAKWGVDDILAYLRTWSAVKRYEAANGEDPVTAIEAAMRKAWGSGAKKVTWPLTLKVGRVGRC